MIKYLAIQIVPFEYQTAIRFIMLPYTYFERTDCIINKLTLVLINTRGTIKDLFYLSLKEKSFHHLKLFDHITFKVKTYKKIQDFLYDKNSMLFVP